MKPRGASLQRIPGTKVLPWDQARSDLEIKFKSYIDEKCNVWFKAKDVAKILGYKNTEHAIKRHVSENHKRTFLLSCHPVSGCQVIKDKKRCPPETGGQVQGRWIIFIDEA